MRRPQSMLARIGTTLAASLLAFSLITAASVAWYVLVPVGQRAASDFAALILLSAQTWVELPPGTRPAFEREALQTHGLRIGPAREPLPVSGELIPYLRFLRQSLSRLTGQEVDILSVDGARHAYAVDLPMGGRVLRLEFTDERSGSRMPLALLFAMLAGALTVMVASILLARRLTEPLARLSRAAVSVGQGQSPEPLRASGPRELSDLVRGFNRMARQVEELLSNRTTLLAGISHDLRSPIARITLAVEMLPTDSDPELIEGMRRDLADMERLISEALELAQGLAASDPQMLDIRDLMQTLVDDCRRNGRALVWNPQPCCLCRVEVSALRRVLGNLIDNAWRYGEGGPVELRCRCTATLLEVEVLDRGPGIPENQLEAVFQPFYRLESSRSRETGGSGLGLAVVRQICAARGWSIELLPRRNGGTRARLSIALQDPVPAGRAGAD